MPMTFNDLNLPANILKAVQTLGYLVPTPIQEQAIPPLLAGLDVLGQAQTGTGKTAAFALPLLAKVNIKRAVPQIIVLVPTRELALQVSEAFNTFAVDMPGLNILPIYGGQGYSTQLRMLRQGVHIVIGTPGRVMDHMRRESLKLDNITTLILDEADEMLRMGFAEDVEWILQQVPQERQIGLFSATMPPAIKAIAETYLRNPVRIAIKNTTSTVATIQQFYFPVHAAHKVDTLARIIESEESDAMIVFVKTKRATEDVAEQLVERGINAVAINGDIAQQQRERVIDQLKLGKIKILIATDVAARGIDVDRITHVINYDAPNNSESYIHRIGRTGRAGRAGKAIIFITPRERYILRNIENATKQPIAEMPTPSIKQINERRINAFKQRITEASLQNISFYETLIAEFMQETSMPAEKVAASLARLVQGDIPLVLKRELREVEQRSGSERGGRFDRGDRDSRPGRESGRREFNSDRGDRDSRPRREFSSDRSERGDRDSRPRREFSNDRPTGDRDSRPRREFSNDRPTGDRDSRPRREFSNDRTTGDRDSRPRREFSNDRPTGDRDSRPRREFSNDRPTGDRDSRPRREFSNDRPTGDRGGRAEHGMDQYRVDIGREHGLLPKNLVGAIANTAGIEGRLIGRIKIEDKFSLIDLPRGMPKNILQSLQRVKLSGKPMNLKKVTS